MGKPVRIDGVTIPGKTGDYSPVQLLGTIILSTGVGKFFAEWGERNFVLRESGKSVFSLHS
jgi:hypothetical protein